MRPRSMELGSSWATRQTPMSRHGEQVRAMCSRSEVGDKQENNHVRGEEQKHKQEGVRR